MATNGTGWTALSAERVPLAWVDSLPEVTSALWPTLTAVQSISYSVGSRTSLWRARVCDKEQPLLRPLLGDPGWIWSVRHCHQVFSEGISHPQRCPSRFPRCSQQFGRPELPQHRIVFPAAIGPIQPDVLRARMSSGRMAECKSRKGRTSDHSTDRHTVVSRSPCMRS